MEIQLIAYHPADATGVVRLPNGQSQYIVPPYRFADRRDISAHQLDYLVQHLGYEQVGEEVKGDMNWIKSYLKSLHENWENPLGKPEIDDAKILAAISTFPEKLIGQLIDRLKQQLFEASRYQLAQETAKKILAIPKVQADDALRNAALEMAIDATREQAIRETWSIAKPLGALKKAKASKKGSPFVSVPAHYVVPGEVALKRLRPVVKPVVKKDKRA